ncbi:MAG: hypothetical protein DRG11_02385 [Epsilonproteobacteria bacterium]|nr:MAG: hypothetical protein DRG11_02385 [Campylobacterota bacterium]
MIKSIYYDKIYYYIIVFFAFILPLSRAGTSLMMAMLLLLWIAEADFKRKYQQIISSKFLLFLIAFIFFTILSIFWTENLMFGYKKILKIFYLFVVVIIATSIKKEQVQNAITAFLAGMFISEVISYGVFFELWTYKEATVSNPSPFNHIHYSIFLAVSSILLLNRLLSKRYKLKEKVFFAFFFLTVTGNLFLSTGRAGQVALVVGVFVMFVIHFRFSIKTFFYSIVVLSVIYTTAYNLSDNFNNRVHDTISDISKLQKLDFSSSWGIRAAFWITTYNSVQEHPFGSGIGDYKLATKQQLESRKYPYIDGMAREFMQNAHPHNQYLMVLLQTGFIGIILFALMVYHMFKFEIHDTDIKEFSVLFGTIFFVGCIAEPLLNLHFPITLFIVFAGLFASVGTKETI